MIKIISQRVQNNSRVEPSVKKSSCKTESIKAEEKTEFRGKEFPIIKANPINTDSNRDKPLEIQSSSNRNSITNEVESSRLIDSQSNARQVKIVSQRISEKESSPSLNNKTVSVITIGRFSQSERVKPAPTIISNRIVKQDQPKIQSSRIERTHAYLINEPDIRNTAREFDESDDEYIPLQLNFVWAKPVKDPESVDLEDSTEESESIDVVTPDYDHKDNNRLAPAPKGCYPLISDAGISPVLSKASKKGYFDDPLALVKKIRALQPEPVLMKIPTHLSINRKHDFKKAVQIYTNNQACYVKNFNLHEVLVLEKWFRRFIESDKIPCHRDLEEHIVNHRKSLSRSVRRQKPSICA